MSLRFNCHVCQNKQQLLNCQECQPIIDKPKRGRPSKREERSDQILDAYERCIIEYGLDAVSLQKVAEEAGIARSLLHHYVGTRDELLDRMIKRFIAQESASGQEREAQLPKVGRCKAYVDFLFNPDQIATRRESLLYQALVDASQKRPALRKQLLGWYDEFVAELIGVVCSEHPDIKASRSRQVSVGIIAAYFHAEELVFLGAPRCKYSRLPPGGFGFASSARLKQVSR